MNKGWFSQNRMVSGQHLMNKVWLIQNAMVSGGSKLQLEIQYHVNVMDVVITQTAATDTLVAVADDAD